MDMRKVVSLVCASALFFFLTACSGAGGAAALRGAGMAARAGGGGAAAGGAALRGALARGAAGSGTSSGAATAVGAAVVAGGAAGAATAGAAVIPRPTSASPGTPTVPIQVRGAQPLEGVTKHFDRQGNYRGYSEHTRTESRAYDAAGRFEGRTVHDRGGSGAYDSEGAYQGRSLHEGTVTRVYDAQGNYKGMNVREGNVIHYYNARGIYEGHSIIETGRSSTAPRIIPVGSDSNDQRRTTEPSVDIRVANCDDACRVVLNGEVILRTGFGEDSQWVDITNRLQPGSNELIFEVVNQAGSITYTFQVRGQDRLLLNTSCGKASVVGCDGNRAYSPGTYQIRHTIQR